MTVELREEAVAPSGEALNESPIDSQNGDSQGPPERTPFEKAVDKAFAYHPFRLPSVQTHDGWVVGPTFIVQGDYSCPIDGSTGHSIWRMDPLLGLKMKGIIEATEGTVEVTVSKDGHEKEQSFKKDKHGALQPINDKKCTCRAIFQGEKAIAEIAFPLLSLGKKVKPDVWRYGNGCLYGFNKGDLVCVLAAKGFDRCLP